jgi:hypothetical protein
MYYVFSDEESPMFHMAKKICNHEDGIRRKILVMASDWNRQRATAEELKEHLDPLNPRNQD